MKTFMQEGSFRCDANVSVRPLGSETFGTRAEIKNLNSFRFIERAIEFEVERQIELIENGGKVTQETRLYDPDKDETRPLRSKEDAHDYRYFPDPDLLPVAVSAAYIDVIRATMPELPRAKLARFVKTLEHKCVPDTCRTTRTTGATYHRRHAVRQTWQTGFSDHVEFRS